MATRPTLELGRDTGESRRIRELAHEVGAFLTGEFTLTSGKKSSYYIDGKRITLSPEGAYLVGRAIFNELSGSGVEAVGGVATGAYPMVTAVAMVSHLEGEPVPIFIVREVVKEHGTMRRVEGNLKEGARVAILEDVLTTGGSVAKAIEAVEAMGCRVARVIALVDRDEGGSDRLKKAGYDFTALLRVAH
ncbi:MAG: orotate phosphoribosyltransferase [Dehalococcoidales bacterium]|nr:orotate phosphoribosyltransferase [Dehalococcoidales bacterium]